jgi:Tol biopolymer transport system component
MSRIVLGSRAVVLVSLMLLSAAFVLVASAPALASDGPIAYVATGIPGGSPGATTTAPEIATMWGDGTHVRTLVSSDSTLEPVALPVWSLNRLWVAYSRQTADGEIRVVRNDGSRDHAIMFDPPWSGWTPGQSKAMAWSPSGRYLVVSGAPRSPRHGNFDWLIMIDLRSGNSWPLAHSSYPGYEFDSISFSPDGRYVVAGEIVIHQPEAEYGVETWGTRLIRISDGATVRSYPASVWGIDIAPDGKHISFVQGQELRTATLEFKQRTTIATEYGAWRYEWLRTLYMPRPALTRWSLDGSHIGVNIGAETGEVPQGPFVGNYTSRGRGFTVPIGLLAGQFDW